MKAIYLLSTTHNIRSQLFSPVVPLLNNPIIPSLTPIPLEYHYPSRLVCHSLVWSSFYPLSLSPTYLSVRPNKDRLYSITFSLSYPSEFEAQHAELDYRLLTPTFSEFEAIWVNFCLIQNTISVTVWSLASTLPMRAATQCALLILFTSHTLGLVLIYSPNLPSLMQHVLRLLKQLDLLLRLISPHLAK